MKITIEDAERLAGTLATVEWIRTAQLEAYRKGIALTLPLPQGQIGELMMEGFAAEIEYARDIMLKVGQIRRNGAPSYLPAHRIGLAGHALAGLLASHDEGGAGRLFDIDAYAEDAVAFADAVLKKISE